jgi:hypothetical protein
MVSILVGMRERDVREWLVDHQDSPDAPAAKDFLNRHGRFQLMEPSTDDREQVFPGPEPAEIEQTHRHGEYHDGS